MDVLFVQCFRLFVVLPLYIALEDFYAIAFSETLVQMNHGRPTHCKTLLLIYFVSVLFCFVFKVLESWSPKLSHENDGLIFNPAEEVD